MDLGDAEAGEPGGAGLGVGGHEGAALRLQPPVPCLIASGVRDPAGTLEGTSRPARGVRTAREAAAAALKRADLARPASTFEDSRRRYTKQLRLVRANLQFTSSWHKGSKGQAGSGDRDQASKTARTPKKKPMVTADSYSNWPISVRMRIVSMQPPRMTSTSVCQVPLGVAGQGRGERADLPDEMGDDEGGPAQEDGDEEEGDGGVGDDGEGDGGDEDVMAVAHEGPVPQSLTPIGARLGTSREGGVGLGVEEEPVSGPGDGDGLEEHDRHHDGLRQPCQGVKGSRQGKRGRGRWTRPMR